MKKSKILRKICLTVVVSLTLTACDDYEDPQIKLVDMKRGRFLNHVLTDKENLQFRATTYDSDLSKLHGHYCSPAGVTGRNMAWGRRQLRKLQEAFLLE